MELSWRAFWLWLLGKPSSAKTSLASFNVLTATVTDLEKLLNNGTLTSEIVVTEYLKQIEQNNGYLHAIIATAPKDLLLQRARFLDKERAAGRVLSPLHGIPLLVKVLTAKSCYTANCLPMLGQHRHPFRPGNGHHGWDTCFGWVASSRELTVRDAGLENRSANLLCTS